MKTKPFKVALILLCGILPASADLFTFTGHIGEIEYRDLAGTTIAANDTRITERFERFIGTQCNYIFDADPTTRPEGVDNISFSDGFNDYYFDFFSAQLTTTPLLDGYNSLDTRISDYGYTLSINSIATNSFVESVYLIDGVDSRYVAIMASTPGITSLSQWNGNVSYTGLEYVRFDNYAVQLKSSLRFPAPPPPPPPVPPPPPQAVPEPATSVLLLTGVFLLSAVAVFGSKKRKS